ncbi:hypothetical cyanophage protein [Synechococcus phage S-CRM01]|uniref:hypothetical cyanophage protein n=1 Tax=Synechococcus phage S-CRM01 TaxID=1026955 RepID=UPI000209E3B6|nr:hypothetical cyanophage protein [Synechococcus phage S-CRM01]AEC53068.1 hypothetical cyanophage protein [Synechococcus phage S-CRM01]
MKFDELNKDNFLMFAIKHYENPLSSTREEFEEDLKRFKYVKRWLKKYHETGDMNGHLLLNHIIIIFNCWNDASIPMLFYKIDQDYWSYLKTFLEYLNRIPEYPHTQLHDIPTDINISNKLKGF